MVWEHGGMGGGVHDDCDCCIPPQYTKSATTTSSERQHSRFVSLLLRPMQAHHSLPNWVLVDLNGGLLNSSTLPEVSQPVNPQWHAARPFSMPCKPPSHLELSRFGLKSGSKVGPVRLFFSKKACATFGRCRQMSSIACMHACMPPERGVQKKDKNIGSIIARGASGVEPSPFCVKEMGRGAHFRVAGSAGTTDWVPSAFSYAQRPHLPFAPHPRSVGVLPGAAPDCRWKSGHVVPKVRLRAGVSSAGITRPARPLPDWIRGRVGVGKASQGAS